MTAIGALSPSGAVSATSGAVGSSGAVAAAGLVLVLDLVSGADLSVAGVLWALRPFISGAVTQGMDVLIATGDRDALQLVNPHVTVLYPRKGVSDLARMTPAAVEETYAVARRPETWE